MSRRRSNSASSRRLHRGARFTNSAVLTRPISNCPKRWPPIVRPPTRGARPPWSNSACCSRPGRASPRTKPRRASCSSARPQAAIPAALPISPPSTRAAADPVKTRAALAKAAETNAAEAQYQLGLMIAEGIGGPKDDVAARALFEKAAAQDHPGALERMGAFAQSGRGGPQDASAAKAYYEKAAALGNEDAKTALKRAQCPYVIKDKRGNVVTYLCF